MNVLRKECWTDTVLSTETTDEKQELKEKYRTSETLKKDQKERKKFLKLFFNYFQVISRC